MSNQSQPMKYDPRTGAPSVSPVLAEQWREQHGRDAWLFNPWTGRPRDTRDVGSDVMGLLIVPPSDAVSNTDIINEAHRTLDVAGVEPSGARLAVRIGYLIEERDRYKTRLDKAERDWSSDVEARERFKLRAIEAEQKLVQVERDANQAIADVHRYAARVEAAEKQVKEAGESAVEYVQRHLGAGVAKRRYIERLLAAVLKHGWSPDATGPACVREARAWLREGRDSDEFKAWLVEQGYGLPSDRSEGRGEPDLTPADAIAQIRRAAHRRDGVEALLSIRVFEDGYRVMYERVYADGSKSDPLTARAPTLRALVESVEAQEAARNAEEAETVFALGAYVDGAEGVPPAKTTPCKPCDGSGAVASDDAFMMMAAVPCGACNGSGREGGRT